MTTKITQEQLQEAITGYDNTPQYTTAQIDQLVHEYVAACKATAKLKEVHSQAHALETEKEAALLGVLEAVGKTTYQVEGVGKVTAVEKTSYKFPADISDREILYAWIEKEHSRAGLMSYLTINAQSFSKLIRTTLEQDGKVPVKIEEKKSSYISLRKE